MSKIFPGKKKKFEFTKRWEKIDKIFVVSFLGKDGEIFKGGWTISPSSDDFIKLRGYWEVQSEIDDKIVNVSKMIRKIIGSYL